MRNVKIRFVEIGSETPNPHFLVEKKTLFGWTYITKTIHLGYGSVCECYGAKTKKELLGIILKEHYKTCAEFCTITEYPSLKIL